MIWLSFVAAVFAAISVWSYRLVTGNFAIGPVTRLALRLRIAYYTRALQDMGLDHPDATAVLLHISAIRSTLMDSK